MSWSFILLTVCCTLFLFCVLFRLNGSSSAFWIKHLNSPDELTGLIAGSPRVTRADEWMVWTPAALAQLHHQPPMPTENLALGAGATPLLMSVPVRHYSMLFRPQFWGFFIFAEEQGFAWFWNTKIFGLLISFYLLLRLLMRGREALAVFGSVAVSYSSYVQWFFSCPPMLPEMLASWALILVAGKSLFDPLQVWKKAGAAILLGGCAINFVLCCYPPFAIPLIYLGLILFGVFLWERGARSCHYGFYWLAGTLIVTAVVFWPTFLECRSTLEIIAHTSYPGARRGNGGTMPIAQVFSGVLNFFDADRIHPAMFPNKTESSNFFPIWLAAMASISWTWWKSRQLGAKWIPAVSESKALHIALASFIIVLICYSVVGLPEWFCRITALNFCPENRIRLPIGLAGLILTFASLRTDGLALVTGWARTILPVIIGIASLTYLLWIRSANSAYLTTGYVIVLAGAATLLGSLYFCARGIVFGCSLAVALLLNNFLVNPISEGLPLLLRSEAAQHIAAIYKSDPTATWASYEGGARAQFIAASGARVLNGIKAVPDLELLTRLDPAGNNGDTYNRYAFILLGLPRTSAVVTAFELMGPDCYWLLIRPTDLAMQEPSLKYVVFPHALSPAESGTMKLIDALPASRFWIYKLNSIPRKGEGEEDSG